MTQRSAREARIHLISEGVLASYIHDISARAPVGAPAKVGADPRPVPGVRDRITVPSGSGRGSAPGVPG
jgi:hypothetical protein